MKKKLAVLLLGGLALLNLTACGEDPDAKKYALIVNKGTEEYEQYSGQAWEGIEKFSGEQGIKCGKYEPEGNEVSAVTTVIDQAVDEGAEVVFCIGEDAAEAVYKAQKSHKKVHFYLIGAEPHKEKSEEPSIRENTSAVYFDEVEQGFLAGYAAVSEGARSVGFLAGEKSERNEKLLSGFIQGAEAAASEAGLNAGAVTLHQKYTGENKLSPAYMADAIEWYKNNCEIIFAPDDKVAASVAKAAENQNRELICADADGTAISAQVLTSANKDYAGFAYYALKQYVNESFAGETTTIAGAKESAVSLDMEHASFTAFPQEAYLAMYQKLCDGSYALTETAPTTTIVTIVAE